MNSGDPTNAVSATSAHADDAPDQKPKDSSWALWVGLVSYLVLLLTFSALVAGATGDAAVRLAARASAEKSPSQVVIADQAEVAYCTPAFKEVLTRVLNACGLEGGGQRRGCQPADIKTLASISDADFNALFSPLRDRGAVLLFDSGKEELDAGAQQLLEERFLDRRGARYFFVVARASKTGTVAVNRALSHKRANSVQFHLEAAVPDADLERELGQLWLGNEFAQLDQSFCDWPNSRPEAKCSTEAINRSVIVSWVDCRL